MTNKISKEAVMAITIVEKTRMATKTVIKTATAGKIKGQYWIKTENKSEFDIIFDGIGYLVESACLNSFKILIAN